MGRQRKRGVRDREKERRVLEEGGEETEREKERSVRGEREGVGIQRKRRVLGGGGGDTEREITCRTRRLLQTFSAPDQECPVPSVIGFKQISRLL